MTVTTDRYPSEVSWTFFKLPGQSVACSGSNYYYRDIFYENCGLLQKGRYKLYCYDSYGDGWNGGSISIQSSIQSTSYCGHNFGRSYSVNVNIV